MSNSVMAWSRLQYDGIIISKLKRNKCKTQNLKRLCQKSQRPHRSSFWPKALKPTTHHKTYRFVFSTSCTYTSRTQNNQTKSQTVVTGKSETPFHPLSSANLLVKTDMKTWFFFNPQNMLLSPRCQTWSVSLRWYKQLLWPLGCISLKRNSNIPYICKYKHNLLLLLLF